MQARCFVPPRTAGGELRVAVPAVEISSAIYEGRFRNCTAGLYIRLHEKKTKNEKREKSGKKERENKGWPSMTFHGDEVDQQRRMLRKLLSVMPRTFCKLKAPTEVVWCFNTSVIEFMFSY